MYGGLVRFICDSHDKALVLEYSLGAHPGIPSVRQGYRFIKSASFATAEVGDAVGYTYDAGFAGDGHDVTLVYDFPAGMNPLYFM